MERKCSSEEQTDACCCESQLYLFNFLVQIFMGVIAINTTGYRFCVFKTEEHKENALFEGSILQTVVGYF